MVAIDMKKELKELYNPSAKEVGVVDVPAMSFLMLDGNGDPNGPAFAAATANLYAVAYALKFKVKRSNPDLDYAVMPLEGLWWVDDVTAFNIHGDRSGWHWTLLIAQPESVAAPLVADALTEVGRKKPQLNLDGVRFERYHEGQGAQIMRIGPYANEEPSISRLHDFIQSNGQQLRGKHHEIYRGDPSRAAPEKLRTIIRQPFA